MNKYNKRDIINLLKHMIYRNVSTVAKLKDSRAALRSKNLPLWVEEPVKQIIDEVIDDIVLCLAPLLTVAKKEYSSRPDRLELLEGLELRFKELEKNQEDKCTCAACLSNVDKV